MKELQKNSNPTVVLKIGGNEIENPHFLDTLVHTLLDQRNMGREVVLVHGGGKKIEEVQDALGLAVEKKEGLRVTTQAVMDAVRMALIGIIGPDLVHALQRRGVAACGLHGSCGGARPLFTARPKSLKTGPMGLGFVGEIDAVNPEIMRALTAQNILPVVAPCAPDSQGQWYNVNADDAAVSVSLSLNAQELFFVTNVPGLLIGNSVRRKIHIREVGDLLARDDITGGMIPKLQAAQLAVEGGVKRVSFGSLESYSANLHTEIFGGD